MWCEEAELQHSLTLVTDNDTDPGSVSTADGTDPDAETELRAHHWSNRSVMISEAAAL